MAHPRELISQAVVALLIAAGTSAGSRVYATRFDPLNKKTGLPAISVYTLNDPASEEESSEMEVAHALELEISCWVAHTDAVPVATAMNALAEQVEVAMRANEYLSGNASEVIHTGTVEEVVEEDGRSDPVVGIAVLTYAVKYHIALAAT